MGSSLLIRQMADLQGVGRSSDTRKDHVSRLPAETDPPPTPAREHPEPLSHLQVARSPLRAALSAEHSMPSRCPHVVRIVVQRPSERGWLPSPGSYGACWGRRAQHGRQMLRVSVSVDRLHTGPQFTSRRWSELQGWFLVCWEGLSSGNGVSLFWRSIWRAGSVSVCLVPCLTSSKEYCAEHLLDCAIAQLLVTDWGMPWALSADPGDTCSQQSEEGRVETAQITPSCCC